MDKIRRIGLTGPTGSGKSELSAWLAAQGAAIIDCDALAREVTVAGHPCLAKLAEAFSPQILRPDGSLDRARLASLAFSSEQGRLLLDSITHPYILALCHEREAAAVAAGYTCVVWDAPLLFESGLDADCTETVAVLASPETRLARIMARDGIAEDAARVRMMAQPDDAFYRDQATAVLQNDGTLDDLYAAAARWFSAPGER